MQAGVVRLEGDLVSAAIRIQSYERMLYVFNRDTSDTAPEETLMLISSSSLEVAHLMTRRTTQNALDIGTGCGFLATVLAPFCNQVTAIDFHMVLPWEEPSDGAWSGNLEKSLAGLGCDVWVARIMTVTAEQYVAEWIAGLSEAEQADAETLTEQARQYFREKN